MTKQPFCPHCMDGMIFRAQDGTLFCNECFQEVSIPYF